MPINPQAWLPLLADPGADGHIVQLYQDPDFYGEAISHFAAEGIHRGESIILVATQPNWVNISGRLVRKGLRPDELFARGQLTLLDADATLPKFMRGNTPDGGIFKDIAGRTIEKARAGGKYPRVRWWGEMVNVLYVEGNPRGSTRLEELFDEVAHDHTIAIFCSFLMNKYNPSIYENDFLNVCRTHSHVIPTPDYDGHRDAVNHAIGEIIGEIKGPLHRSLLTWKGAPSLMPSSQAMLMWVKDAAPHKFHEVLARAQAYEEATSRGAPS